MRIIIASIPAMFFSNQKPIIHEDRRIERSTDAGNGRNDDGIVEREYHGSFENKNSDRFRGRHHDGVRDNRYQKEDRRPDRERFDRDKDRGDFDIDARDRSRYRRERSGSGYYSDHGHDDFRRDSSRHHEHSRSRHDDSARRRSFDRSDRNRHRSEGNTTDEDDTDQHRKKRSEPKGRKKSIEWPPCFQKKESAFAFDARSAMFYEPLSNFFYDPKSKLYYGNKKCAYYRYDETKDPPFVEVQKLTSDQVEEQKQQHQGGNNTGIIEPEKIEMDGKDPAAAAALTTKPKIAIRFKTKKVKSSAPAVVEQQQPAAIGATVSKAKQQQIANIGKWNEKQAELKKSESSDQPSPTDGKREGEEQTLSLSQAKVRTTAKGEPICMICKRKFPNLAKLRLHEKSSELHKKNLLKLQRAKTKKDEKQSQPQETIATGTKRKLDVENSEQPAKAATSPPPSVYTDRAEKRRQLHGVDLGAPVHHNGLHMLEQGLEANTEQMTASVPIGSNSSANLLDETNVGHKLLTKMGYQAEYPSDQNPGNNSGKPKTANDHLRKEWDRIEAMAQKSVPRYR